MHNKMKKNLTLFLSLTFIIASCAYSDGKDNKSALKVDMPQASSSFESHDSSDVFSSTSLIQSLESNVLASSQSDNESSILDATSEPFSDYSSLLYVRGAHILNKEDQEIGHIFHSYEELFNYSDSLKFTKAGRGEDYKGTILEALENEDFTHQKLILPPEVMLRGGHEDITFDNITMKDGDLIINVDRYQRSSGGSADINYALFAFFVDDDFTFNNIVTNCNDGTSRKEVKYQTLNIVEGSNHLLKDEDKDQGVLFTDYVSLISYQNDMQSLVDNSHWKTGVYSDDIVSFIETVDQNIFDSYNLLFSKELIVPDTSYTYSLTRMYLENNNLHFNLNRSSSGAGFCVISYNVFAFLLDKSVTFNHLVYSIEDSLFGIIE